MLKAEFKKKLIGFGVPTYVLLDWGTSLRPMQLSGKKQLAITNKLAYQGSDFLRRRQGLNII